MHNFKKCIYPVLFIIAILCINEILVLALKPCTNFRNDIHKLEKNQYDDLFVGTSHGKAGINPEVVDRITGERSLNLCLGGEEVQDSYYIIKEACRVNKPKKIIYELDPGYWVTSATLGPEYRTIYDELPMSGVKTEYYLDKIWNSDFRTTLFPWYLYRKGIKGAATRFCSKFSQEYRNYDDRFYNQPAQSYTEQGQIRIHRSDAPKTETNLILWDKDQLKPDAVKSFTRIVNLCKEQNIKLMVVTTPVPQETLEKYHDNFENANKFFTSLMEKEGVEYYNYNYQEISGFDRSLNGFSDYEGHMYEEQSDIFSKEVGKIMQEM